MKEKVLSIINEIRAAKEMTPIASISAETKLREDLKLLAKEVEKGVYKYGFLRG